MVLIAVLVQQNIELGQKNQRLTDRVADLVVDVRKSQFDGCNRTNERTRQTNRAFVKVLDGIISVVPPEAPSVKEQLKQKKKSFKGIELTNCYDAYPEFKKPAVK